MKKALIFVGILILLGAALYWAGAESRKETKASAPAVGNRQRVIPVETVELHRGTLERHLYLTGSIVAEATVDVFSKVSGILERIRVNQGDRVEADQVIAMVEREEKEAELQEAILLGGRRRLRPILMTTFTTALALAPMAVGFGEGSEINAPLARVVIGGMLVSALFTMFFVPTLYASIKGIGK